MILSFVINVIYTVALANYRNRTKLIINLSYYDKKTVIEDMYDISSTLKEEYEKLKITFEQLKGKLDIYITESSFIAGFACTTCLNLIISSSWESIRKEWDIMIRAIQKSISTDFQAIKNIFLGELDIWIPFLIVILLFSAIICFIFVLVSREGYHDLFDKLRRDLFKTDNLEPSELLIDDINTKIKILKKVIKLTRNIRSVALYSLIAAVFLGLYMLHLYVFIFFTILSTIIVLNYLLSTRKLKKLLKFESAIKSFLEIVFIYLKGNNDSRSNYQRIKEKNTVVRYQKVKKLPNIYADTSAETNNMLL